MESNIYQTPKSDPIVENDPRDRQSLFYVVSLKKFLLLYFGTFGFYQIYWFYKHWSEFKIYKNFNIRPFWRAFFSIFYTHSLFSNFDDHDGRSKIDYSWNPPLWATVVVLMNIFSNLSDRLPEKFYVFAVGGPIIFVGLGCARAQKAANIACNDASGKANNKLTPANYIWLVLGAFFWLLALIGLYDILVGIPGLE